MEQKKYFERLNCFKTEGIRFGNFFGRSWYSGIAMCVFVGIFFISIDNIMGFVLAGFVLGAVSRDIGLFVKSKRYWPLQKEIIDWGKVDKLAANEV